jgi:hypothetical protein
MFDQRTVKGFNVFNVPYFNWELVIYFSTRKSKGLPIVLPLAALLG